MISFEPQSPHALVKSSDIEIPNVKAPGYVVPRRPIARMFHFNIEYVRLTACIGNEILFVRARILAVIQRFGNAVMNDKECLLSLLSLFL